MTDDRIPTRDDIRARERRRASERCAAIRASRERKIAEIAALKAQVKALKALGTLARRTQCAPQTTEKSEIGPTDCMTHEEIVELVDDYVDYYNNEKGQARLG